MKPQPCHTLQLSRMRFGTDDTGPLRVLGEPVRLPQSVVVGQAVVPTALDVEARQVQTSDLPGVDKQERPQVLQNMDVNLHRPRRAHVSGQAKGVGTCAPHAGSCARQLEGVRTQIFRAHSLQNGLNATELDDTGSVEKVVLQQQGLHMNSTTVYRVRDGEP